MGIEDVRLRQARRGRGMTIGDVAEEIGTSRSTLYRWSNSATRGALSDDLDKRVEAWIEDNLSDQSISDALVALQRALLVLVKSDEQREALLSLISTLK